MLHFLFPVSGAGIDLASLSIVEGKYCWDLYIEGLVVSSDGNLLDTMGAAIKVHFINSICWISEPWSKTASLSIPLLLWHQE